jgi:hypothetical protein
MKMQSVESIIDRRAHRIDEALCHHLPDFDPADLEVVRHSFRAATPHRLQQTWLSQPQIHFAPATVRTGWRNDSLLVFAELSDVDIFNAAATHNERTWELGDTFEIFLKPSRQDAYVELHVTPNNHRLQLRYASAGVAARVRRTGSFDEALLPHEAFYSLTWIDDRQGRWSVYAEIPSLMVCDSKNCLENAQWRFSFGRYDYTRGNREPVISSSSPHTKPDFHRPDEWGAMTFKRNT